MTSGKIQEERKFRKKKKSVDLHSQIYDYLRKIVHHVKQKLHFNNVSLVLYGGGGRQIMGVLCFRLKKNMQDRPDVTGTGFKSQRLSGNGGRVSARGKVMPAHL